VEKIRRGSLLEMLHAKIAFGKSQRREQANIREEDQVEDGGVID
jgi:hypothetical protein